MASLMSLFKLLSVAFITSFLCLLYFLLKNKSTVIPDAKHHHYENKYNSFNIKTIVASQQIRVIPMPKFVSVGNSELLSLTNGFRIISKQKNSDDLNSAIARYSKYISAITKFSVETDQNSSPSPNGLLIDCSSISTDKNKYPTLGEDESYSLNISNTGAHLYALSLTGIIRGLSTFVQLIRRDKESEKISIPFVSIVDKPRFSWRGLMLDVSRHWMPVSVIERTLNAMELSKLNVFHFHLSDDQGFRVESLKYPLLHDRKDFFTQKEIQYLVEYARQRRIRIVPEFDIPGHTTSWFVGYPELASAPGPYTVETAWGIMKPVMDPTKEKTYEFLDVFFKEMSELFPDSYFHIGGDEVEGFQWSKSTSIQQFIKEKELHGKSGLQAYFNRKIQTMLKKYDKFMIGWEEILDEVSDNLAVDKDAVIQSWKSRHSLVHSAEKGYSAILSNGYYLDHLESSMKLYSTNPITDREFDSLNEQRRARILGGEACMWSEYVSENTVDSRIWPRTLAVAERLWSPTSLDNEKSLYKRLFRMNRLFGQMQLNFTYVSLYKHRLQKLITDPDKRVNLLHPFMILADISEPFGHGSRSKLGTYTTNTPLTTFADALQSESELAWKLENLPMDDERLRDMFHTWSVNHARLQTLFDEFENDKNRKLWGQDIEELSKNLAQTGQIGLRILDYKTKKILHHDKTNAMNSWTLSHWVSHHSTVLDQLEIGVREIRLAAVRPVRVLLKSIEVAQ